MKVDIRLCFGNQKRVSDRYVNDNYQDTFVDSSNFCTQCKYMLRSFMIQNGFTVGTIIIDIKKDNVNVQPLKIDF